MCYRYAVRCLRARGSSVVVRTRQPSSLVYYSVHGYIRGYTDSSTPFHESDAVTFSAKKILPMVVVGVVVAICYPQGCSAPFVLCHSWWTPILRPVSPLLCAPFDVCSTVPFLLLIYIVRFSLDFRSGFV